jgi:hypothetical protein
MTYQDLIAKQAAIIQILQVKVDDSIHEIDNLKDKLSKEKQYSAHVNKNNEDLHNRIEKAENIANELNYKNCLLTLEKDNAHLKRINEANLKNKIDIDDEFTTKQAIIDVTIFTLISSLMVIGFYQCIEWIKLLFN